MRFEKIIDLTLTLEQGMPTYPAPWHPVVELTQLGRFSIEGRQTTKIVLGTHTGTHIDAPAHFLPDSKTVTDIKLDQLMGEVSLVDFSGLGKNELITLEMVKKLKVSERMIFYFDWSKNWDTQAYYREWPYFTKDAAEHLVQNGLRVMGLDTPSPDASKMIDNEDCPVHKILLGQGVVLLEYLTNLTEAIEDPEGWGVIALPMKIRDADGAPARICLVK